MEILQHQKEQIDTLTLGIKAAQEEKFHNENKMLADALAQQEAKKTLDEKYHRKYNKSLKKIKKLERKKRRQFAEELQYYNMLYNNPQQPYYGYGMMSPMMPRPF